MEINEALGKETVTLYENEGYVVELRKDMQGKDRMVKANFKKNSADFVLADRL